ncbi:response regulator [uncultured Holdemanella sp.]|uniref:response regulator n=1 Tax=uncultured Holdemanella sp. TaxID=1763549 RepID=UPI0025858F7B|nr:response regulator [uncultured Holdemanella sp.]
MRIKSCYYHILTVLLGVCIIFSSAFYLFQTQKDETETKLVKIVNYVKVQCSTYTHYNEASESKSLLRTIESCRQLQTNIQSEVDAGNSIDQAFLKENLSTLWMDGSLVLDENGNIESSYSTNDSILKQVHQYICKDIVLNYMNYPERTYSQRIELDDGSRIDIATCARSDAPGIVATYFYTSAYFAQNYNLTLQNLLKGYSTKLDGTILVCDEGSIIASNDRSLLHASTKNNEVVQLLKKNRDSQHIYHFNNKGAGYYGIMLKQSNYYIFAYIPDHVVFEGVFTKLVVILLVYILFVLVLRYIGYRNNRIRQVKDQEKEKAHQEELLKAAKKAEAANVAKTEFLQRMSHDIRTPINGIIGMVEVGDHYSDDIEKQADCRAKIKDASKTLLELVNEVLDMSKLESGEIVLEEVGFNINKLSDETIGIVEELAKERNIQIVKEKNITHPYLMGSPTHVKRVLMNVLSNAIKYNRDNGFIYVSYKELEAKEPFHVIVEFICRDTGIGMSKKFQNRIFEPFAQEHIGSRSKYVGTGLGMPIAKSLVEKMGGTIEFTSQEGVGSQFVMRIPFKIDQEHKNERVKESVSVSIEGLHVLLVEDNELNMEIARFIIENEGARVICATNGKEAVDIYKNAPESFDIILMDIMMPEMDGLQATQVIRSFDHDVPIVAMTANAFAEDKMKAKKAGMNAHVSKPLDKNKLIQVISKLCGYKNI